MPVQAADVLDGEKLHLKKFSHIALTSSLWGSSKGFRLSKKSLRPGIGVCGSAKPIAPCKMCRLFAEAKSTCVIQDSLPSHCLSVMLYFSISLRKDLVLDKDRNNKTTLDDDSRRALTIASFLLLAVNGNLYSTHMPSFLASFTKRAVPSLE